MPKILTKEQTYDRCIADGMLIAQEEIDTARIRSKMNIAKIDLQAIAELKKKTGLWTTVYKLSYEIICNLCEAFLIFDKIEASNHQCLFSYICIKYPEFDLDWNFFEKIRTKMNGISYFGKEIGQAEFKEIELQALMYTNLLIEKINKRLEE